MMATGHAVGSAALVLGLGEISRRTGILPPDVSSGEIISTALASVPFSFGAFSPDADQRQPLKRWFGHRYAVHWFGWPLLVLALLWAAGAPLVLMGPPLGWMVHIWPLDYLFGKGGPNIPRGIPRWPWRSSPRHGLNLRVTANRSRIERTLIGRMRSGSILEMSATLALAVLLLAELGALRA